MSADSRDEAPSTSAKRPRVEFRILDDTVAGDGGLSSASLAPKAVFDAARAAREKDAANREKDEGRKEKDEHGAKESSTAPKAPLPGVVKVPKALKPQQQPAADRHRNCIGVNRRQRGNPVLKLIRSVPWEFQEIEPDFALGRNSCALFLSVRYHSLHPEYVHARLKQLGRDFDLRVLLLLVDTAECSEALKELNKICLLAAVTLILAWTNEEAARYLECYKSLELKPPDAIMERQAGDFLEQARDLLTCVRPINKTDVACLVDNFGSVAAITEAEQRELERCPGLGRHKAQRLRTAMGLSFRQ